MIVFSFVLRNCSSRATEIWHRRGNSAKVSSPGAIQEKRLALVIGNSNYDSIADLKNPVNDAKLIANTLDSLDFDVMLATDLDYNSFYQKIGEFADKRKNYDVGFFYYAGHGLQIEGDNYLLPINNSFDKKWKIKSGAIKVNDILEYLTSITD